MEEDDDVLYDINNVTFWKCKIMETTGRSVVARGEMGVGVGGVNRQRILCDTVMMDIRGLLMVISSHAI